MVIKEFTSKLVFLDTAPLIYFIEGNSSYQNVLSTIFSMNDERLFLFVTYPVTLLEILVKPLREKRFELANQYKENITKASFLNIPPINNSIAETAAELRAEYNLRTPEALQLAVCLESGADYFLSNDKPLRLVKSVSVVLLNELE